MKRQTSEKGNLTTTNFRRRALSVVVAAFLSTFVASAFSAFGAEGGVAAATALDATGVEVGIAGAYKNGFQTPVVAFWKGSAERVELETRDSDGTPFVVAKTPSAAENAAGRAEFSVVLPKATAALTLRCVAKDGASVERTFKPETRSSESATVFTDSSKSVAKR